MAKVTVTYLFYCTINSSFLGATILREACVWFQNYFSSSYFQFVCMHNTDIMKKLKNVKYHKIVSLILSDSTTYADFRPIKLLNVYNYATYTGYTYIQVFRFLKHIMTSETFNDNMYMHFVCFKRTKPHVRSRADAQHCASAGARPYGSNTTIGTWKADEADKVA